MCAFRIASSISALGLWLALSQVILTRSVHLGLSSLGMLSVLRVYDVRPSQPSVVGQRYTYDDSVRTNCVTLCMPTCILTCHSAVPAGQHSSLRPHIRPIDSHLFLLRFPIRLHKCEDRTTTDAGKKLQHLLRLLFKTPPSLQAQSLRHISVG